MCLVLLRGLRAFTTKSVAVGDGRLLLSTLDIFTILWEKAFCLITSFIFCCLIEYIRMILTRMRLVMSCGFRCTLILDGG